MTGNDHTPAAPGRRNGADRVHAGPGGPGHGDRGHSDANHSVAFSGVGKRFGPHQALDDVTFALRPGRVTGLLGPNGAGKSTLLRILLGLARADHGTTRVFGAAPGTLPDAAHRIGVAMDALGFAPRLTVRRHLEVAARALALPSDRVDRALEQVGLAGPPARRRYKSCSTGMRQRLALATALLPDPDLVVLDEPLNGLDPEGIRWMRHLVEQLAARGRTILIASHLLSEVEQSVDDIVVLHRRVLFHGSLADLVRQGGGSLEAAYFNLIDGHAQAAGTPLAEASRA
ncbi:ATP-binding cassette domain-containing protein [Kitasatospora sp. NPDC056731]|uniref:ABC transporter ATP-binding protein n=1 Tax=Kitasatospora sp. NPDC056731 TaxID=3155422 RepID=UPI003443D1F4